MYSIKRICKESLIPFYRLLNIMRELKIPIGNIYKPYLSRYQRNKIINSFENTGIKTILSDKEGLALYLEICDKYWI